MKFYHDYKWVDGVPKGCSPSQGDSQPSYKIVADPYRKWISIEEYEGSRFKRLIYDSKIFDFRNLKPINQTAWQKSPGNTENCSIIRDQNDRVILLEQYTFRDGRCRLCQIQSPHGLSIGTQRILYQEFGDPFDGVELYDNTERLVMFKKYAIDPKTNEFGEMLEENWRCVPKQIHDSVSPGA